MTFFQYDPTGIFEQNPAKGGVCEVKSKSFALVAATANQVVITGTAGKRILVLSGDLAPVGAAGVVTFSTSTGPVILNSYNVAAAPANQPILQQPWGVFNTATGDNLLVDNTSVAIVRVSLRYIEYTP